MTLYLEEKSRWYISRKEKGSDLSKIIVGIGINLELGEEKRELVGRFLRI